MKVPLLDLKAQYATIQADLETADAQTSAMRNDFVHSYNVISGAWIAAGLVG